MCYIYILGRPEILQRVGAEEVPSVGAGAGGGVRRDFHRERSQVREPRFVKKSPEIWRSCEDSTEPVLNFRKKQFGILEPEHLFSKNVLFIVIAVNFKKYAHFSGICFFRGFRNWTAIICMAVVRAPLNALNLLDVSSYVPERDY